MSYVAYHKDTTVFLTNHPKVRTDKTSFATESAAKAAITREANRGAVNADDFLVADKMEFYNSIEKDKEVVNRVSGVTVKIKANTPWCCNPASEQYHSM